MKKISVAIVCSILMLSLVGCGTNEQAKNNKGNVNTDTPTNLNSSLNGNANMPTNNADGHLKDLTSHIGMVEGVKDSRVLVNEKDIIIGLEVDENAEKSKIEQQVQQMIQENHAGYNVHVTSDATFYDRIHTINGQLNPLAGQPVKDVTNDIKTLLDDIGKSIQNVVK